MVRPCFVLHVLYGMAGLLVVTARASADESSIFQKPVRLQADGKDIDTGKAWGHSGPCLAEFTGDGLRHLVVGDFSGKFHFYRNVGSNQKPKYTAAGDIMAGSSEAQVPIYCCIGSSPQFVDFFGRGKLDLLSGSYDPGECYLFRAAGAGKFAERETINDKNGKPILRRPDQRQKFESFGSWPVMVDWNNDGKPDLLVGGFDGTMFVRLNEGTREEPKFSTTNLAVEADGKELKVPGHHAAPAVVDWDGDGRWDILSGSETGAVYVYRNIGELGHPKFAAAEVLIPEHKGHGYDELIEVGAEPVPGIRTQIATLDYNGDGKVDLLVGDFLTNISPRPDLTLGEREAMQNVQKEIETVGAAPSKAFKDLQADFEKRYPGDEIYSDKATAEWSKAYQEMHQGKAWKEYEARSKELNAELGKYLVRPERPGTFNEYSTTHGYVWLFLRK
jgi:hypothetical protein